MALNPSGAISLAGPVAGQSIAVELGVSATATISLNNTNVRTLAQVPSGVIVMPTNFWGKSNFTNTQKAIFGFGQVPAPIGFVTVSNLVSNTGVVASDTPGAPGVSSMQFAAGATYGGDKAIFGFGNAPAINARTNLISNTGVIAADTPGVPGATSRYGSGAAGYGGDKAIFAYGARSPLTPAYINISNLVSNTGVVAADTPGVGTARGYSAGATYGGDKAIFGYGSTPAATNVTNLVSNTGVVASDTPGVGTARDGLGAATYGGDKAIFAYGTTSTIVSNLVSNTGVVAGDTPIVGVFRRNFGAAGYGGDKAIFGYGQQGPVAFANTSQLVSNTGVVAANTPGVGTARRRIAAAGYSLT